MAGKEESGGCLEQNRLMMLDSDRDVWALLMRSS
jgi:hypothetical protein